MTLIDARRREVFAALIESQDDGIPVGLSRLVVANR